MARASLPWTGESGNEPLATFSDVRTSPTANALDSRPFSASEQLWVGRRENENKAVLDYAQERAIEVRERYAKISDHFFPDSEVRGIAGSVERYREQWAGEWHSPQFIGRQKARGKRSGKGRRGAGHGTDGENGAPGPGGCHLCRGLRGPGPRRKGGHIEAESLSRVFRPSIAGSLAVELVTENVMKRNFRAGSKIATTYKCRCS